MPETHRTEASDDSERTLLLDEPTSPRPEVSLPKLQLFILSLLQFTEEFSATIIFPFAPILVLETGITGGDVNKLGYYTGLLVHFLVPYFKKMLRTYIGSHAVFVSELLALQQDINSLYGMQHGVCHRLFMGSSFR